MPRLQRLPVWLLPALLVVAFSSAKGGEVTGKVEMPATCSTIVNPAVVTLEPLDARPSNANAAPTGSDADAARVALVHQQGLQFEPRVQAISIGRTIRFTNEDAETHNVHILTPGMPFNQTMSPGKPVDFKAEKAGVIRLACDIHSHMRGYVVVSPTPWAVVVRNGKFRLDDVTPGRYRLVAWHEMGEPFSKEITVGDDRLDVGTLQLTSNLSALPPSNAEAPVRAWPEVVDRISLKLSEARVMATRTNGAAKARKLAEDAYWDEFESSDMETAVRSHLGFQRSGELEGHFRDFRYAVRDLSQGKAAPELVVDRSRSLILALHRASDELKALGIPDRTKLGAPTLTVSAAEANLGEIPAKKRALVEAFQNVQSLADTGDPLEAASAMTTLYFDAFEPIERVLLARRPQDIRPLEVKFNAIRGEVGSGLKGNELGAALAKLQGEVDASLEKASSTGGAFLPAFVASLVTILREGVEVILILTMLVALVTRTGRPQGLSAIKWGVGLAAVASLATAFALNLFVSSSQGRARELIEGWVLLCAAGVLFYVSYWLISQSEAKRWTDFLKRHAAEGAKAGALGTLGLTAFLAVFREGAETALMYQAMLGGQRSSSAGIAGIVAGIAVGVVLLGGIYRVLKTTSVRLPLGTFFKATGAILFLMAVVFAGNGVFELQQSGVLRVTEVRWMQGRGLSWLGVYPSVQALSVQALLLTGALLAWVLPWFESRLAPAAGAKATEPVHAGV